MHSGSLHIAVSLTQPGGSPYLDLGTAKLATPSALPAARHEYCKRRQLIHSGPHSPSFRPSASAVSRPSPTPQHLLVYIAPSGFCSNLTFGTPTLDSGLTLPGIQMYGTYQVSKTRMTASSYTSASQDQNSMQTNQTHLSVSVRRRHTV